MSKREETISKTSRRIGGETLTLELGQRAAVCLGAEHRWAGRYRKYLILNAKSWRRQFWAEWIVMLIRWHWDERYDATGRRMA